MSLSSMELESSLFRSSTAKSVAFLTVYKHIDVHLKGKSVTFQLLKHKRKKTCMTYTTTTFRRYNSYLLSQV